MLRIGRYRIAFGRTSWVQTRVPTTVRHFLCFWVFKEARPQDVDKEQKFPIGTKLEQGDRVFRYWKACDDFELRPADILVNVITGGDPYSRLKRWFIGPYAHVFWYLGRLGIAPSKYGGINLEAVPMLCESNSRGVVLQSLSNRYGQKVVVMRLKDGSEDFYRIQRILNEAIKLASDERSFYDYFCVVSHVLPRVILEKLGMPIPLSWQRDARQICSEAVLEICLRAKVPVLPDNVVPLPGDFVTDSPLLELVGQGILSEGWIHKKGAVAPL